MNAPTQYLSGVIHAHFRDPDGWLLKFAWVAASGVALYLLWHGAYPPFIDAANVAYTGEVMHDLWRGGSAYSKWHALRPGAVSHLAFYRAYHVLRYLFAPVATIKILATLGVLTLPVAMLALVRAMKLGAWLSLPAFALAFNTNLSMGYLPFVIGIPLVPLALTLIEHNANEFRWWRCGLLGAIVLVSPWFHLFLTAILVPIVIIWCVLSLAGRPRIWTLAVALGVTCLIGLILFPRGYTPKIHQILQWIPYAERWDQLDRDVLQWTTDGKAALSFPWLLLAFVSTLWLTRKTPTVEGGLRVARAPILALVLFLGYLLGPTYISWPEPAWGFGTRIGIALALMLPLVSTTSSVGWRRFWQLSPWVAFTFWHLLSLVAPFRAYDALTRPLSRLSLSVPHRSRILPVFGSEWMKDPERYAFGGFAGFAFRHVGKWLAVETQSYQPGSFCDAGYHPISCVERLPAPQGRNLSRITADTLSSYDYMLVQENIPDMQAQLGVLPLDLVRREGDWSLWRVRAVPARPAEFPQP